MNSLIAEIINEHGLDQAAWVRLQKPLTMEFYKQWIAAGLHADMEYLRDHMSRKENPPELLPRAKSALVVSCSYVPHPFGNARLTGTRTALYAGGQDYHLWLKEKLQRIVERLKSYHPGEEFLAMTDSQPVLERDLAHQAGFGWFGKNNCLIHPRKGSFFFIAEIYSTLEVSSTIEPLPDFCGTCTRCIDICPTGALSPHKLDSAKCISYLTIESKSVPTVEMRAQMGDWFFGCDLCQTVCPWNQKVIRGQNDGSQNFSTELLLRDSPRETLVQDLRYILQTSGKQLSRDLQDSPLLRARPRGLKRNAMIVAANRGLHELRPEISEFLDGDLDELARWCLTELEH